MDFNDLFINGEECLKIRAIKHFPEHFRGLFITNIVRASRYWKSRAELFSRHQLHTYLNNLATALVAKNDVKFHLARRKAAWGRKCMNG